MHRQSGYPLKYHNKIDDYISKIFQQEHTQVHCPATRKCQILESAPEGSADPVHDWMIHCVPASPLPCFLCHGLMDTFPLRVVILFDITSFFLFTSTFVTSSFARYTLGSCSV